SGCPDNQPIPAGPRPMRNITAAFLFGAYLFLALTAAALIWRGGFGAGAGTAALFGVLGFCVGVHAMVSGALARVELARQLAAVREAHRLLADALESTQGAIGDLAQAVESGGGDRTDELTG